MMEKSRIIGYVVAVHGFRVKVELSPDVRSSSRATPDGVIRAIAINAYLLFDLGAGNHAIGILTDLEASETYDPTTDNELSLELTKPRRIASIQLLGTVKQKTKDGWQFDTGITVLPTLDTPAEVANFEVLEGLFSFPPKKNKPQYSDEKAYDFPLEIGHLTGDENTKIKASFNDLLSRPLAVVGNTGSGKSYTVASLLSNVVSSLDKTSSAKDPHIFILDINGEYSNAFLDLSNGGYEREPNKLYLNGEEFCIPAWFMNAEEICNWLQASEAIQEPILKDWWAIAKASSGDKSWYDPLELAVQKINSAIDWLGSEKPNNRFKADLYHAIKYAKIPEKEELFKRALKWEKDIPNSRNDPAWKALVNEDKIRDLLHEFKDEVTEKIKLRDNIIDFTKSADSPLYVPLDDFHDPILINRSDDFEENKRIDQYLLTLKLRLRTRLDDKRWQSFFNYEDIGISSFQEWMSKLGFHNSNQSRVVVLDMSMLASEILPFACAIMGRLLLESREMLSPHIRSNYPWLLVLEEAHNYVRPPHIYEDRSIALSRKVFERVAKEGRKFGLSLIVASQRPSEISQTIISQCANFFSHRLQNPDDIDHFRRIIPKQAQRLLDQVTVLANGEAIVFGSSVHIPSRVQINKPVKEPWSATAAPYLDWNRKSNFQLDDVLSNWGLTESKANLASQPKNIVKNTNNRNLTENTNDSEKVNVENGQENSNQIIETNDTQPKID